MLCEYFDVRLILFFLSLCYQDELDFKLLGMDRIYNRESASVDIIVRYEARVKPLVLVAANSWTPRESAFPCAALHCSVFVLYACHKITGMCACVFLVFVLHLDQLRIKSYS